MHKVIILYITVLASNKLHGQKPLAIDGIVKLVKEPENTLQKSNSSRTQLQ